MEGGDDDDDDDDQYDADDGVPSHVLPSCAKTKPVSQLQRYEPSELEHCCWHPPLKMLHSFTSDRPSQIGHVSQKYTYWRNKVDI